MGYLKRKDLPHNPRMLVLAGGARPNEYWPQICEVLLKEVPQIERVTCGTLRDAHAIRPGRNAEQAVIALFYRNFINDTLLRRLELDLRRVLHHKGLPPQIIFVRGHDVVKGALFLRRIYERGWILYEHPARNPFYPIRARRVA